MEEINPASSIFGDFKWKYTIIKPDSASETVTIEGPKDQFAHTVLKYAKYWLGPEAKVDHRARIILAPGAKPLGQELDEEHLATTLGHLKTGAVEYVLTPTTSIVIRVIPTMNSKKQTYKILYDAIKVGSDYACTKTQLVKKANLANAVAGLYYTDIKYSL